MCEKCDEIVVRIARYGWMKSEILDEQTLIAIDQTLVEMDAEKAALHPRRKKSKAA